MSNYIYASIGFTATYCLRLLYLIVYRNFRRLSIANKELQSICRKSVTYIS